MSRELLPRMIRGSNRSAGLLIWGLAVGIIEVERWTGEVGESMVGDRGWARVEPPRVPEGGDQETEMGAANVLPGTGIVAERCGRLGVAICGAFGNVLTDDLERASHGAQQKLGRRLDVDTLASGKGSSRE
jgi:hypothetical protein